MKLYLLVCLSLLVIASAIKVKKTDADQPSPPNSNSGSCINQTPGLTELSGMKQFENIFLPTASMGQLGQCMGLWNGKQTCCEYDHLVIYARKQIQSASKLDKYVNKCQKYTEIRSLVENYNAQIEKHDFLNFLHIFSVETDFKDFISSNQMCSQHMIQSKNSALCTICLKDTKEFYRNGKALISSDSCSSMLQVCSTAISKTFQVIKGFNRLLRSMGRIEGLHKHVAEAAQRTSEKISEKMAELNIVQLLDDYRLPLSVNSQTEEIQVKLCGSLFSLLKDPLTIQLDPVFEAYAELTAEIFSKKEYVKKLVKMLVIKSNGNPKNVSASSRSLSRRLFTTTTPENILIEPVPTSESPATSSNQPLLDSQSTINSMNNIDAARLLQGDVVVMKKSDNMFSSYDGIKGSTLDNQYSVAKTINLKVAFP